MNAPICPSEKNPATSSPHLLDASTASSVLGVHRKTLIRWVRKGVIKGSLPNGKWLFYITSLGIAPVDHHGGVVPPTTERIQTIYARVSTPKQLDDLQSQIRTLKTKYPDHVVFSDCASGLNFKRKGLLSLLQLAFERRLQVVRIAHRDRICSFAFYLLKHVFRVHGAEILVEASDLPPSAEHELAEDVLSAIAIFGAHLNGAGRRGGRSTEDQETQEA